MKKKLCIVLLGISLLSYYLAGCGGITIEFEDAPKKVEQAPTTTLKENDTPAKQAEKVHTNKSQLISSLNNPEIQAVLEFVEAFYTDWFNMANVETDFMKDTDDMPDYQAFYDKYASQDADVDFTEFYAMELYHDMEIDERGFVVTDNPQAPPSDIYAHVKTVDAIKILGGGDNFYKVGVILTIEGPQTSNNDNIVQTQYMGSCTVISEDTGYKIDKYISYIHSSHDETDKSEEFLRAFSNKLLGKGEQVDVIKDPAISSSEEGVSVESAIILDEKNDTFESVNTDNLDVKALIKENDPKTVAFLGANDSLGSGFFIAPGVVVTNFHVIADQTEGIIRFVDGSIVEVDGVITADPSLDLAVLKLTEAVGDPVRIGSPSESRKGDEVLAIGSPLGLFNTVTIGLFQNVWQEGERTLLQSSLPLAPGNSGGPLFNASGEVIGINTMIMEGYADISIAVSIDHLRDLIKTINNTSFSAIDCTKLDEIF